jgi:hypothetical protein
MIMNNIPLKKEQFDALNRRIVNQPSLIEKSEFDDGYNNNEEFMGLLKVSKRTAQRWRMSGQLPFVKIGKKLYYPLDSIMNSFCLHTASVSMGGHSPPLMGEVQEVDGEAMECVKCPLFVILNS